MRAGHTPIGGRWTGSGLAAEGHLPLNQAFWVNDAARLLLKQRPTVVA